MCIGREVGLMEVRLLTAHLLLRFSVALAPGEDGKRLLDEFMDHFTMTMPPLDIVFTKRE